MFHPSKPRPWRAHAIALPLTLLACGGLVACGSSTDTTGTTGTAANAAAASAAASSPTKAVTTAPSATATTTKATGTGTSAGGTSTGTSSTGGGAGSATSPAAPGGAFAARFAAVRTCLQKDGITLPPSGSGGPGAMLRNPQLPSGVTRAQYAEALRKCGTALAGGPAALAKRRFGNTRFRQALVVFANCLRQNGVPVPQPNTSGSGPIFSTRGLDTSSPKFRAARQKCRATLLTALRATAHSGTP